MMSHSRPILSRGRVRLGLAWHLVLGLAVPRAAFARTSGQGKMGYEIVSVGPCEKGPGASFWGPSLIFAKVGSHARDLDPREAPPPFHGWVERPILEGKDAVGQMREPPLDVKAPGYIWILVRLVGGRPPLPLFVPTVFAEALRANEALWFHRDGWSAVFFRAGGRPVGALVTGNRGACWDTRMQPRSDHIDLRAALGALPIMATEHGFDAEKSRRQSGIDALERIRVESVPPPISGHEAQAKFVVTVNRKSVSVQVGQCLVLRGPALVTLALLQSRCVPPSGPVEGCCDDPEDRYTYMILFEPNDH
jgi:hypothetical protein